MGGREACPAAGVVQVCAALRERVAGIPGCTVEDNKFCCSVHFRNCAEADYGAVQAAVADVLQAQPELRLSRGRKVLELRPEVRGALRRDGR